ncbi:serine/threonine-protein kinase [Streptomyces sp. 21So2-11]|uniref:serine/threonine-protein kinase n=1 Tax=Streptomyces sp. 21So2-11 TaxID=3144408 RepID=UPI003219AC54
MNATPLSPEDPTELGGFRLTGRIGHGGMGQVYLGESPAGEAAAVKVIKPSVVDSETRQRFAQEIEVLKTVWGPRIAAFMDADTEAERPWLATEYVEGPELRRQVDMHGTLSAELTASLGATLAEALSGVHKQGLLHRDLKPANILLGPNGPKIIDFGLAVFAESSASLTAPNMVVGTPACMSPEQATGVKPLSPAVDVYALGAVLLYAATNHYPYPADSIHAVFHGITDPDTQPDLSGAPDELLPLLAAMLAQSAADRPTLAGVVQQCVAIIKGHGLAVAQARRRLTRLIAAEDAAPPAPGPAPLAPTVVVPKPAASEAPTAPLPATATYTYTPTVKEHAPAPALPVRDATPRPAAPRPAIRSAAARRVAGQLREAYAQSAPF